MSDGHDDLPETDPEAPEPDEAPPAESPPRRQEPDLSWLTLKPAPREQDTAAQPEVGALPVEEPAAPPPAVPSNVVPLEPLRRREPPRVRTAEGEPARHEPLPTDASAERVVRPEAVRPSDTQRAEGLHREVPQAEPRTGAPGSEPSRTPAAAGATAAAEPRRGPEAPDEEAASFSPAAVEAAARARRAEERRDYRTVVDSVQNHLRRGYSLLGLVGYSGSGKTHFLRALSLLLRRQGFEAAAWESFRRARVPGATEASVFDYPCTGPRGEKWVFVDAGGELYARLRANNWDLPEESAALLRSLYLCRGLFLLLHLQPGHFRAGSLGSHRWLSEDETHADHAAQQAQEELEFFDHALLFLRALQAEGGKVQELVVRCAAEPNLDKALRPYRDKPRLDIPVMVLFTQADTLDRSDTELGEGSFLSPRKGTVNVAAFAARHLPGLFGSLVSHTRRFKFDFVQSYEEFLLPGKFNRDGTPAALPKWEIDDELLSVGVLPALEFLYRNLPVTSGWRRHLRRFELETPTALRINRLVHRRDWQGVEVP
jgi:hypothetical protein